MLCAGLSSLGVAAISRSSRRLYRTKLPCSVSQAGMRDGSDLVSNLPFEDRLEASTFKEFLRSKEAEQPLWYRLSDLYLTFLGSFLFYLEVCEPQVAEAYNLEAVEDVVNVNFLVRFLLLFWANDFQPSWLWTGKAILDLVSCLPFLGIPARFMGGAGMEKALDILELARFLRLLRLSLPSKTKGLGSARDSLQIVTVLLALGGTIVLSACLLFFYENPRQSVIANIPTHSFEDCVLYMLNIFTNKDTTFLAETRSGKQVTVAATAVGAIFLPFLISGGVQVFMGSGDFLRVDPPAPGAEGRTPARGAAGAEPGSPVQWAAVVERLDGLEEAGLLKGEEALELRRRCMAKEEWALTLDLCYGQAYTEGVSAAAGEIYAARLREWLSASPES